MVSKKNNGESTRVLSIRERQFIAAIRRETAAADKEHPGTIHAVRFKCTAREVSAEIVHDRNRGAGKGGRRKGTDANLASEQPGLANQEPLNKCKPVPQHKPAQRKEKATPSVQRKEKATPSPTPAAPSVQTDGGSHMCLDNSDADSEDPELLTPQERQHALARMLTDMRVRSILRKTITSLTTEVVRSLGGDEKTGGQFLHTEKTVLNVGTYKFSCRLPIGSKAANMSAEEFSTEVETSLLCSQGPGGLDMNLHYLLNVEKAVPSSSPKRVPSPARPAFHFTAMSVSSQTKPAGGTVSTHSPGTGG